MRAQEAEDAAGPEVSGVPDGQDQPVEEDQEEDDLQIGAEGQGELFEGLQDEQGMPVEGDEEEEEEEDEDEYGTCHSAYHSVGYKTHADFQMKRPESSSQSGTESLTWISWYCSLPGHECRLFNCRRTWRDS
jgi:casein kinase II subunit beta